VGQAGNDTIYGGVGNDKINGNDGNDNLDGGAGNDLLTGEWGNDVLSGGDGNDTLVGYGNSTGEIDTLTGGAGNDTFGIGVNFSRYGGGGGLVGYTGDLNAGYAIIQDWESTDFIELKGNASQYTIQQEYFSGSSSSNSSSVLDTTIYYGLDLIGVVEDSTNVASSNFIYFT
jgi:Ca2+-binding RTX toxin-like protein